IRDYTSKAFDIPPQTPTPLKHLPVSITQNLCDLYKSPTGATVAYMQNRNDKTHLLSHLQPFHRVVHSDIKLLTLVEPWREGHTPSPKEFLTELLDTAISSADWIPSLVRLGFQYRNLVR